MMKCRTPTLIEVYGFSGELCSYWGLTEQDTPPWNGTDLAETSTANIDKLLFTTFGERPVSNYLMHYIEDDGTITAVNKQVIARYIMSLFKVQWARLTADYTAEYNPVQNYDMTEQENSTNTASGTDTSTDSFENYKEVQKYGHTVETTNQAYPYDSTTPHDTDVSTTVTGAAADTGDEFSKTGEAITEFEHGKVDTFYRTLTRAGNIGVQTATDMIKSDSEFWSAHNFFMQICADIASIITIPIYD